MPIRVEIVRQDRPVVEGDVDIVVAPGEDGEMGILPHHAPLLTTLKPGERKVRYQGREEVVAISGGVMEVQPTLVTVLADAAERSDEIDVSRAEEARSRAEASLAAGLPANSDAYLAAEAALHRSNLRLQVARRRPRQSGVEPRDRTN